MRLPDSAVDAWTMRTFLEGKEQERQHALAKRLADARRDFRTIVDHLIRAYEPMRIYQWGSLVDGRHFSEISDIDVAVEGLTTPERYFAALGDAMRMTGFHVDLIELERINPEQAEHIRQTGRLIYERPSR